MIKKISLINFLFLFLLAPALSATKTTTTTTQTYELKNWFSWALENPTKITANDIDNLRLHITQTANIAISNAHQKEFTTLLSKLIQKGAQLSATERNILKVILEFKGKTTFITPETFTLIEQSVTTLDKTPALPENKSYVAKITAIKGKNKVLVIISELIRLVDSAGKDSVTPETQQTFIVLINQILSKKDKFTPAIKTAFISLLEKSLTSTFLTDESKKTIANSLATLKGTDATFPQITAPIKASIASVKKATEKTQQTATPTNTTKKTIKPTSTTIPTTISAPPSIKASGIARKTSIRPNTPPASIPKKQTPSPTVKK